MGAADEFLCVTLIARPGEGEADFAARLSAFWTHMLRTRKADFEKVYAEAAHFEEHGGRLTRRYLVAEDVPPVLETELAEANIEHAPVDPDDTFTKYEAVAPEWWQIEH
jgi:hypothetical protein